MDRPARRSSRGFCKRSTAPVSSPPELSSTNSNVRSQVGKQVRVPKASEGKRSSPPPSMPVVGTRYKTYEEGKKHVQGYFKSRGIPINQMGASGPNRKIISLVCSIFRAECPVRAKFKITSDGGWELFQLIEKHDHNKPGMLSQHEKRGIRAQEMIQESQAIAERSVEVAEGSEDGVEDPARSDLQSPGVAHDIQLHSSVRESRSSSVGGHESSPSPAPVDEARPRNIKELQAKIAATKRRREAVEASLLERKKAREKKEKETWKDLQHQLEVEEERLRIAKEEEEKEARMDLDVKREID